jgi:hypothetical protein
MAQSGFTPIQIYYSTTAGSAPLAANLANGELAINTADGILYYKDSAGVVEVLASGSSVSILSVRAATTANITLSGLQTVDGISLAASDRVLVKDQTLSQNNGVYVASAGAWARAIDANSATEIAGRIITVRSGTLNGGEQFATTFKSTDTLGTTAMAWFQVALQNTAVTFAAGTVITGTDNVNAALRITQLGTGNALLVEDSTNPDATPFVINNAGRAIQGTTQAYGVLSGGTSIPPVQTHAASATSSGTGFAAFNWATTTGSSVITYAKSRGGVIGTHAVVANGDVLGADYFYGSDGTNFISAAYVEAEVDGTPATNDMPGRLTFGTTAAGASTSTERMRITNAGNVGIGLTAPPQLLAVGSNTDQFGAGVSGTVTTAYFGSPSTGSGGIKRLAYDRSNGNFSVIGGSVASPSTQVLVSNAGRVVIGSTSEQIAASGVNPYVQQQGLSNDATSASITDWQVGGFVGPLVLYNKSKGGAVGTRGAVAADDRLGTVVWSGDDGTAFIPAAQIQAHVDGTPGTNDMPGRLSFFTTADGAASVTERMRIDRSGNVGIGLTPTEKLMVQGPTVVLGSTSANQTSAGSFDHNTATNQTRVLSWGQSGVGGLITFWTGDGGGATTQRMTIDSSGNLGLGVTPSAWATVKALQVGRASIYGYSGTDSGFQHNAYFNAGWNYIATDYASQYVQQTGGHVWKTAPSGTAGAAITFTQAMTLDGSGNLGIGTSSPGNRLSVSASGASGVELNPTTRGGGTNGAFLLSYNRSTSAYQQFEYDALTHIFNISNTERARIDSSGNVLVGTTTSPSGSGKIVTTGGIVARVNALTTIASPWAWNSDLYDQQSFSALANALTINADAGTPTDGEKTVFRFKDNGTARALTWTTGTSNSFRAIGVTLPTTTVINKTLYVGCIYNALDSRWDVVAVAQEA